MTGEPRSSSEAVLGSGGLLRSSSQLKAPPSSWLDVGSHNWSRSCARLKILAELEWHSEPTSARQATWKGYVDIGRCPTRTLHLRSSQPQGCAREPVSCGMERVWLVPSGKAPRQVNQREATPRSSRWRAPTSDYLRTHLTARGSWHRVRSRTSDLGHERSLGRRVHRFHLCRRSSRTIRAASSRSAARSLSMTVET